MTHATRISHQQPLPFGTRVLNQQTGEPATVLNGTRLDQRFRWIEYAVITCFGNESWSINDILIVDDVAV